MIFAMCYLILILIINSRGVCTQSNHVQIVHPKRLPISLFVGPERLGQGFSVRLVFRFRGEADNDQCTKIKNMQGPKVNTKISTEYRVESLNPFI